MLPPIIKLMLYIHTLFPVKRYTILIKMLHRFIHLQVDAIHETFY